MQQNIHPPYQPLKVTCACGNEFTTASSMGQTTLRVDVCNECHPFYTGKHKLLDTAGRVDKFMKRYQSGSQQAATDSK